MKKAFLILVVFLTLCAASCKSAPNFADVSGKEWKLIEVQVKNKNIGFDRSALAAEGFGDIFTLKFDTERISGAGAPNRYFAPYTLDKNQAISIKTIAGTLMAPLRQPEKLKEHDYFMYLENSYKWDLAGGKLELLTKAEDSSETKMIFSFE
jgi:heat shock protein HslJ